MPHGPGWACVSPPTSATTNHTSDIPEILCFLCLKILFKRQIWSYFLYPAISIHLGLGHRCKFIIPIFIPYFPPSSCIFCCSCSSPHTKSRLSARLPPPILPEACVISPPLPMRHCTRWQQRWGFGGIIVGIPAGIQSRARSRDRSVIWVQVSSVVFITLFVLILCLISLINDPAASGFQHPWPGLSSGRFHHIRRHVVPGPQSCTLRHIISDLVFVVTLSRIGVGKISGWVTLPLSTSPLVVLSPPTLHLYPIILHILHTHTP